MFKHFVFADDGGGAGGGAAVVDDPGAPSPAPAAPAPGPSAPAAPAPKGAAPAAPAAAAPAAGYWAADWRERLAGGDAKVLAQLQRYASPEAVWQKTRSLEQMVTSGELKPVLGKNAKPEEVAAYRQAHGIPAEAKGYEFKDLKIDDADMGLISHVMAAGHAENMTPQQMKAVVGVWPKIKADAIAAQEADDAKKKTEGEDELRGEWGGDFRRNMSLVHQLLDSNGDAELKDLVLNGRLADGTPIGSSPKALKMLLGVALANNPTGTLVPGGGADPAGGIREELAKIDKLRTTDRRAYDKDTKMQERERELISAAISRGLMDDQGKWLKG